MSTRAVLAGPDQFRVLVACSDVAYRKQLIENPSQARNAFEEVSSGSQALMKLESAPFDAVVLDRHLPDLDSEEVAEMVRRRFPGIVVQLVDSKEGKIAEAAPSVSAPGGGPSIVTTPSIVTANATTHSRTVADDAGALPGMVGNGRNMQQVYQLARLVARRDTTVLITGETGTGKELVSRAIHQISPRSKNPFVVVNCAAIPEALLEAELFGHARGAFTGAVQSRLGRVHMAHGGTLFLDEIGDLPLGMQAKLLRFLQDGEVQRLGSSDVFRVDVRVICATNVRLLECVKQKTFRQDLYYRIAVFPIELPPLRERTEDLAPLAEKILSDLCREANAPAKRHSASSLAFLRQSQWPGNVRELQHAVERAFILAGEETQLHVEHFSHTADPFHFKEL